MVDNELNELSSMPHMGPPNEGERPHTAVHRKVLRQILLARLGDAVRLGAPVSGYEETADGVTVRLAALASTTTPVVDVDPLPVMVTVLVPDAARLNVDVS